MLENIVIAIYFLIGCLLTIFVAIADQRSGALENQSWILFVIFYFGLIVLWPGYLLFAAMVSIYQHINEEG